MNIKPQSLMMTAIGIGAFLSHFTAGVVNVSLPHLNQIFHTSMEQMRWLTMGYLLVIAILLPLMGKLGDRFGHAAIHHTGYILFTASSVAMALSPSFQILLLARILQAIGASMFQATNIALISAYYPAGEKGKALGILTTCVAIGAMAGPVTGGLIADWLGWQWLFFIHVPLAAFASWLAIRHIKNRNKSVKSSGFDGIGAIMLAWIIASFVYTLSIAPEGRVFLLTNMNWNVLWPAGGLAVLIWFLYWERKHPSPFVPIALFRIPSVSIGLAASVLSFMTANSLLVAIPVHLFRHNGMTSSAIGGIMLAYPLMLAIASPLAGRWADSIGSKPLMLAGMAAMTGGTAYLLLQTAQLDVASLLIGLGMNGIGMGLVAAPSNKYVMEQIPQQHAGSMGSMLALSRNAGMAAGAAIGLGVVA